MLKSVFLILALCFLSYGLRLNRLGLYEIDWYHFALAHQGLGELISVAGKDRLFAGAPLALLYLAFGHQITLWHAAVFVLHVGNALLFFVILRRVFPAQNLFALLTASLFAVYPAVESFYTTGQFHSLSSLFLTFVSLYLLVRAVDGKDVNWILITCSVFCVLIALFIYELPLGLSFCIPLLLWVFSGRSVEMNSQKRLRWVGRIWLPFLAAIAIFLIWRLGLAAMLVPGTRPILVQDRSISAVAFKIIRNYTILLFYVWQAPVSRLMDPRAFWLPWLPWMMAGLAGAITIFWVRSHKTREHADWKTHRESELNGTSARPVLILVGLLLTGLGFASLLLTPYSIPLANNLFSRVDIAATPGAAFTLVAIAMTLAHRIAVKWEVVGGLMIAILVGLATGSNFIIQEQFVTEWLVQQNIWSQLTWRAPALRDRTVVLLVGPQAQNALGRPFDDFEVSSALNFIYNRNTLQGEQVTAKTLARLNLAGYSSQNDNATAPLDRILVTQYGQGCLKVINGQGFIMEPNDSFFNAVGHLSNVENILADAAPSVSPRAEMILGKPRTDGWCHFYERAELARQERNWDSIPELLRQAEEKGLMPEDPSEWAPFVEALDRTENYELAERLIFKMLTVAEIKPRLTLARMLENLLQESLQAGEGDALDRIEKQLAEVNQSLGKP